MYLLEKSEHYHFDRHCFSDLVPTCSATAAQDIPVVIRSPDLVLLNS